jgi:tetratricopeptide (TPR) repeat protein
MPISNETGDSAKNYVTDGLTDNLIRQLSELPGLRVTTRSAVDRVKRADVARALGVTMVLASSLQRDAGGRLVLNSELSNVKDGTVISSRQHLADESDLPSVQADVVQDVVQALGIVLDARQSANALRPSTTNVAAFHAFLRGQSAGRDVSPEGLHTAIRNYEEAIRQDHRFALAYVGLAESHEMLGLYFEPATEHMPLARQYAERALVLDPKMGRAHGTLGLIDLVYEWDIRGAENELASADTRLSAIHTLSCTSHLYHFMGSDHIRHAEEDIRRLLEFDPHSAVLIAELGCVSYYAGRYDDSLRYYRDAVAADPRAAFVYWGAGRSLAMEGRYVEALETLRQFKAVNGFEPPIITAEIGYTEAASGDRRTALATVNRLEYLSKSTRIDPYFIALVYLGLKDQDRTFVWLNRAFESRSPFLISIGTDPKWSASQNDPRFQEIWNRMMEKGRNPIREEVTAMDPMTRELASPERP